MSIPLETKKLIFINSYNGNTNVIHEYMIYAFSYMLIENPKTIFRILGLDYKGEITLGNYKNYQPNNKTSNLFIEVEFKEKKPDILIIEPYLKIVIEVESINKKEKIKKLEHIISKKIKEFNDMFDEFFVIINSKYNITSNKYNEYIYVLKFNDQEVIDIFKNHNISFCDKRKLKDYEVTEIVKDLEEIVKSTELLPLKGFS